MPDETEVRELYGALIDAWNRRDATAMAALFAEDGNIVGFDGSQLDGRSAIESVLAGIFAQHPTPPYVAVVRELRWLAPTVALVRAVAGMAPPGQAALNPALNAIHSLVAARRDGPWRIELFQNTPAAFHGRPEAVQALTDELRRAG